MSAGRLIAVVGPSGAGKDSLIAGLVDAVPDLTAVRRVITRPAEPGGEPFESVSEAVFARRADAGEFALRWQAHGLSYGIPERALTPLAEGRDLLVNLSRGVLEAAARRFPRLHVLVVEARPEVLARRLAARGREDAGDIARRLARPAPPLPPDVTVDRIDNSGALSATVAMARAALYPPTVPDP